MTNQRGAGPPRQPLPPINFEALAAALLAQAEHLVPMWLPGGAQRGHEYQCASLSGGRGSSCSVNLSTGRWGDFATDEKGSDLVALYAAIHGLDMGKAAVQVARDLGLEDVAGVQRDAAHKPKAAPPPPAAPPPKAQPEREKEKWRSLMPVPEGTPAPNFNHYHRRAQDIVHRAAYRVDGHLMGFVVRFRTSDGGKDTLPYTWCVSEANGSFKWQWKQWDEPRPLFYPGGKHPHGRTVIVVEGEVKAEVLQALLDAGAPGVYCVVSWPGGSKAWDKALWSWLEGCTVLLWPDCDAKREPLTKAERAACADDMQRAVAEQAKPLLPEAKQPGMKAMLGIGARLRGEHGCTVQLLPIPKPGEVVDGWDARDAIEVDGWDFARVAAFFGQAQPLPADVPAGAQAPEPKALAAGGGKGGGGGGGKIDGLADAGDGGDADDDDLVRCGGRKVPRWLSYYWDGDRERWLTSRKMVIKALEADPLLRDVLGLNELSSNIEARVDWPWPSGRPGPVTGSADLMLGQYLSETYGLPSIARAALSEAIETVAHARPFHPVRIYLEGLQWDESPRLDKWLVHVLGEKPETLPPALFEYLCQVGRYWLLAMVYRVMEPGCKFDYCPVLEGPGGMGKSTMLEVLASAAFFSDAHFDLTRGKEGQEQVQGIWLYELAELASLGKAEVNLIKAFISSKVDRYRPSYGRTVEAFPRQAVMAGTTNEDTYLRDRTGNRRFWPVPVRQRINIPWLQKWRNQLFAEAYALFMQGAAYTPTPADENRLYVPMQESRLVETAVLSEMMHVLTRPSAAAGIGALVNELTDFVTMSQMTQALGVDAAKSSPALEAQIRAFFAQEGWQRIKKQINGVRAHGYARPRDWPKRDWTPDAPAGPSAGPPAAPPPPPPPSDAPPGAAEPATTTTLDDDEPF